jgi:hypothetical protein
MIVWISSMQSTDRIACILAKTFGAKRLFLLSSHMWRVKLKWMLNKCFVRMWIEFICPTEGEWGISKLQNTIEHNQVYWKITDTAIR